MTNKKHKKTDNKKKEHKKNIEDESDDEHLSENEYIEEDIKRKTIKLADKTREQLKKKIVDWLDNDDKIKLLNLKMKKYKEEKKIQEQNIMDIILKLGMEDSKIDVQDKDNQLRSRVYRYKSITKAPIKENIIKDALMETIRDEKKVDQLIKKIENKRPINERYYLKRTKGNLQ